MTFLELLNKYRIEIPCIQRAYIQGLNAQGELFIDAIFEALTNNQPMDLDFIYGPVINNCLIPIDGQQRLTTMFLLHWYIGSVELNQQQWVDYRPILERFTYSNRNLTTHFCNGLTNCYLYNANIEDCPAEFITNLQFFNLNFRNDPSVISMLEMIKLIHRRYSQINNQNLFGSLNLISFKHLELIGFSNPDQLYIKMNARGKQLTCFENFKADLINYLNQTSYNADDGANATNIFGYKIDNEWTDAIWSLLNSRDLRFMDNRFLNFFRNILLHKWIDLNINLPFNDLKELEGVTEMSPFNYFISNNTKYIKFNYYKIVFDKIPNILSEIDQFLRITSSFQEDIEEAIQPSWALNRAFNPFEDDLNQKTRIAFYALYKYIISSKSFDKNKLKQWMRITWNIIENVNTDINSEESMVRAFKLVHDISDGCDDIYLSLNKYKYPDLNLTTALSHEIKKVKFISSDIMWEQMFIEAEKHQFLRGDIDFMIDPLLSPNGADGIPEFGQRTTTIPFIFRTMNPLPNHARLGFSEIMCNNHKLLRAILSRYAQLPLNIRFNDRSENQKYLKKRMSGDEVFKKALYDLMCAGNLAILLGLINNWIANPINPNPVITEICNNQTIINSMYRENGFITLYEVGNSIFMSNNAGINTYKLLLNTNRNEIISALLALGADLQNNVRGLVDSGLYENRGTFRVNLDYKNNSYSIEFEDNNDTLRIINRNTNQTLHEFSPCSLVNLNNLN